MHRILLLVIIIITLLQPVLSVADYLWPLPYGKEMTSIFCDWRARHYHSGIDIRTGGRIGLPIVAPESGYLWRVKVGYYGYGKALYLKMKDGRIAVFGHLSRFQNNVEQWVINKQIENETYDQNLFPEKDQFYYNKGDTLAWSGASGAGAPHLHFEIRNTANQPLNPLFFKGIKVRDTRKPIFKSFRIVGNRNDMLAKMLGEQVKQTFFRTKKGIYRHKGKMICDNQALWLTVEVDDRVGVNKWRKSIHTLELWYQDKLLSSISYDSLDFSSNYNQIDKERNFQMANLRKKHFHNLMPIGLSEIEAGMYGITDKDLFSLKLIATDINNNKSVAIIDFQNSKSKINSYKPNYKLLSGYFKDYGRTYADLQAAFISDYQQLVLLLYDNSKNLNSFSVSVPADSGYQQIEMIALGSGYFIQSVHDIRNGDDSASWQDSIFVFKQYQNSEIVKYGINCDYQFVSTDRISSGLGLQSDDGQLEVITGDIEETFYPLNHNYYFKIETNADKQIKSYRIIPDNLAAGRKLKYRYYYNTMDSLDFILSKAGLYKIYGNDKFSFMGSKIDTINNYIEGKSYRINKVTMLIDTIPPVIKKIRPQKGASLKKSRPTIKAIIDDDLSGIDSEIEIRIDGIWCVPIYDPEKDELSATPHFNLKAGQHKLEIIVKDKMGNVNHYQSHFRTIN